MPLRDYAVQIVSAVWGRTNFEINAFNHLDFSTYFKEFASLVKRDSIIIIEGNFSEDEKCHLQRFLNKELFTISDTSFFWQSGDYLDSYEHIGIEDKALNEKINDPKSAFTLPDWIDDFIFTKLGAKYSPDHIRFEYNLNLNKEEVLAYLGTYFPRSYAEVYILLKDLLVNSNYYDICGAKKCISILDLGCGTGGDIIGLLSFIDIFLPFVESVNLLAIDGNHQALRMFEKVLTLFKEKSRLEIRENIGPAFIGEENDLDIISRVVSDSFDFILSCKTICEMLAKGRLNDNAYKRTVDILSKKLSPEGIMLIEDVTIKIPLVKEFIPNVLNKELNEFIRENPQFSTLAPISCKNYGNKCKIGCFFKKEIVLSHSQKTNDISKFVYRFISHKCFADKFRSDCINLNNSKCQIT